MTFATGVPGFLAGVDRDAVIDEPSANGALHFVDSTGRASCDT